MMITFLSIQCVSVRTSLLTRYIPRAVPATAAGPWQAKKNERSSNYEAVMYELPKHAVGATGAVPSFHQRVRTALLLGYAASALLRPITKVTVPAGCKYTRAITTDSEYQIKNAFTTKEYHPALFPYARPNETRAKK